MFNSQFKWILAIEKAPVKGSRSRSWINKILILDAYFSDSVYCNFECLIGVLIPGKGNLGA